MRKIITLFFLSVLVLSCKSGNTTEENANKAESSDNNPFPIISVGKGPDALFLSPDKQFLYVANVEDTTISVINTATDRIVKTINGIHYPWGFVRLGQSNQVAVSAYDKQVVIIDFTTNVVVKKQVFDDHLGGITANEDGSLIYVISIDRNQVLQLDGTSLEILGTFPTGKGPDGIGISKDESRLFVTNTEDGTISIINIDTKQQKLIQTGGKPELVHANDDHSLLFISNFFGNKVHVIDTETGKVIHDIENIKSPEEAVLSEDEKLLYVASFENSAVYVFDALTYKKQAEVYKTGTKPIGIIPVKNKLYVSNYGDNSISVIPLKNLNDQ